MTRRRVLRVAEAAEVLGIARATAYRYVAAGLIPHVRIGSRLGVYEDALERWLDQQTAPWFSSSRPSPGDPAGTGDGPASPAIRPAADSAGRTAARPGRRAGGER